MGFRDSREEGNVIPMTSVYRIFPYHDKPTTTTSNRMMENVPWDLHD